MDVKYLAFMFGIIYYCEVLGARQADKLRYVTTLMEHLSEPISMRKGVDRNISFIVPKEFLSDRFRDIETVDRTGLTTDLEEVTIKSISLPDLSIVSKLDRTETFSQFLPMHHNIAAKLIQIFMEMHDPEEFLSASVFYREHVNPYLYVYALSVAMLHRPDMQNIPLPSLAEVFPHKFLDRGIFAIARQEANVIPVGSRVPIEIPLDFTASNLDPEHRVAYFREDVGINQCHWFWHLVYIFQGPIEIVDKHRGGELFYFFHEQIIARYNFERLSNNLGRVERFPGWFKPIKQGYFPKLEKSLASRVWPSRQAFAKPQDVNRETNQLRIDILEMNRWEDRVFEAIHQGVAIAANGTAVPLTEATGINTLGYMIEPHMLSVNEKYYGSIHNSGHSLLAFIHDPDGRHLEGAGVMGDTAVAMRDPLFYTWHARIDDIFQEHKNTLPRYTVQQLDFPGVTVVSINVVSERAPRNEFHTFWQKSDVDLSKGLDFVPRGSVSARLTHLQHSRYEFQIEVMNTGPRRLGTMRIFLAPMFDERGLEMLFRDQKNMFVQLDAFRVQMLRGSNTYLRRSDESSVTIPFERTFRNLTNPNPSREAEFNFCGCGWPEHMQIPKGQPDGQHAVLFAMVTDTSADWVEQPPPDGCQQPYAYCGWRNRKYPDKRSMGFPFDRMPRRGVNKLGDFLTPNMFTRQVRIRFIGEDFPYHQRE